MKSNKLISSIRLLNLKFQSFSCVENQFFPFLISFFLWANFINSYLVVSCILRHKTFCSQSIITAATLVKKLLWDHASKEAELKKQQGDEQSTLQQRFINSNETLQATTKNSVEYRINPNSSLKFQRKNYIWSCKFGQVFAILELFSF